MNKIISKIESFLPQKKIDIFGKDSLMNNTFPYYLLPSIVIFAAFTLERHAWVFVFIIYTLLPILDQVFTVDTRNPSQAERKHLQKNDSNFKMALYVTIAFDWWLFFRILQFFASFHFTFWEIHNMAALLFIYSNLTAVQFAIAHEIFHKPGLINRVIGTLHMSKALYMHFTYEHIYGHHRRVATPEDPAFGVQGVNAYSFALHSFLGSYKSVFEMEQQVKRPIFLNAAVLSVVSSIIFTSLVFYFYGPMVGIFFLIQAAGSIFYLEVINYIEHYGLQREKLPNGQYQKTTIKHSWNAPQRFSNYLLFKLQRHSDHHENCLKPYQTLVSLDESPHLPHGYTLMILMALFPSIWFNVMDPLVNEYKKIKIGNVQGETMRKSLALTKKFGTELGIAAIFLWSISALRNF